MPTILLIRHAQASFGGEDYDVLSARGRRQAEILGTALDRRGLTLGTVRTGTAVRHAETAAPLVRASGTAALVDPGWDEYDVNAVLAHHGETTIRIDRGGAGATSTVPARDLDPILTRAMLAWLRAGESAPCNPTWPEFRSRGEAALAALGAELEPGETVPVFTSAGVIAALCAGLLSMPEDGFVRLSRVIVNAGVTKIVRGAGGTSLISFNDHSHLEAVDRSLVTYQ